jgi:hypothetical protein
MSASGESDVPVGEEEGQHKSKPSHRSSWDEKRSRMCCCHPWIGWLPIPDPIEEWGNEERSNVYLPETEESGSCCFVENEELN